MKITSPEAILLPVGINSNEILENAGENHIVEQAKRYIIERNIFKGIPTVKKFSMLSMYSGELFHLMVTMNNRGGTSKDIVFEMNISRKDLILIYIRSLEVKIKDLSSRTPVIRAWR